MEKESLREIPKEDPVDSVSPQPTAGDGKNTDVKTRKRRVVNYHRWTLGVNIATLLVISAYTIVACNQWQEMIRSANIANESAKQASRAADIAEKTLKSSDDNSQLEQRAWVGMIGVAEYPALKPGKYTVNVIFTNSGKTPALNFKTAITLATYAKNEPFVPRTAKLSKPQSIYVVHPGMRIPFPSGTAEFTQEFIDRLKKGDSVLYIFGEYSYEDIFKYNRGGKFCMYLDAESNFLNVCHTYNEAY